MFDSAVKQTKASENKGRKSDATDEETLSDIEEETSLSDGSTSENDDVPEPDADPIEHRKERDDAGPM